MSREFSPNSVWSQVPLASRTVGAVTGNLTGSVGSVTGPVGSVTGAVGSVTGPVGSVTGNVNGQVVAMIRSTQVVTVTLATVVGTSDAAITSVTLAKARLIPLSFTAFNGSGAIQEIGNWDFASVTRVQVSVFRATTGAAATAKVQVVEYY